MNKTQTPLEHAELRRNILLSNFSDNEEAVALEKAIPLDKFNVEYADHKVFTTESLSQYVEDCHAQSLEKGISEEDLVKGLQQEFETLTPVLVKSTGTDNKIALRKVFVRKD